MMCSMARLCSTQGPLASGTFGAWNPVAGEMEMCDVGNAALEGESDAEDGGEDAGFEGGTEDAGEPNEAGTEAAVQGAAAG